MNEPLFCPVCGEELRKWDATIMECPECLNMFNREDLEEAL